MAYDIEKWSPRTGRLIKEDGTTINEADYLINILTALTLSQDVNLDTGTATSGSQTTITDTSKSYATDIWKNAFVEVSIGGVSYLRQVTTNDATTLTFATLPGAITVVAGNVYQLKIPVNVTDIERWGGTALTGRDISLDLKALTDDSIKGLLKSFGDIATGENLITRFGARADSAQPDSTQTASFIAFLKGLLASVNLIKNTDGIKKITDTVVTQDIGYGTLIEGQVTMTGSAIQVGANTACKNVTIQSEPTNGNYIYIGRTSSVSSTVHMYTLVPGASITFTASNINLLYVIGTASDKICYGGES